jgi:hypothetical protein
MDVFLNALEISELDKQDPATASDGGYQSLLVSLQRRVDRASGRLTLTDDDLRRIQTYAFDYGIGGWEDRLVKAFGRTLGSSLGREGRL